MTTAQGSATAGVLAHITPNQMAVSVAASGVLKLYPGEDQAVIPVEIIGDNVPEPDEDFYLDVTNPVGGSFGQGIVTLSAMRTIVNDDSSWS